MEPEPSARLPAVAQGILFVVSGPSGAGKSTLVSAVIERNPGVRYCRSMTTRPQRPGEIDGREYHFVAPEEFAKLMGDCALLEHANVYGYHYGRSREQVIEALHSGDDVVINVDVQGANSIRLVLPGTVSIFIIPPSLEVLTRRLAARGTEMSSTLERRIEIAREEIKHYREFDYLIVNDDLDSAPRTLEAIIQTERSRRNPVHALPERMARLAERHRQDQLSPRVEEIAASFASNI